MTKAFPVENSEFTKQGFRTIQTTIRHTSIVHEMCELSPEIVADSVIREMIENGRWEEMRVQLASILKVNGDYKVAKTRAQEILATEQVIRRMKEPKTTHYDIARVVEQGGGIQGYRNALSEILTTDNPTGVDIQKELAALVDHWLETQAKR
jgi:hypothetical protein